MGIRYRFQGRGIERALDIPEELARFIGGGEDKFSRAYLSLYTEFMRNLTDGVYPSFHVLTHSRWSMGSGFNLWVNGPVNFPWHTSHPKAPLSLFDGEGLWEQRDKLEHSAKRRDNSERLVISRCGDMELHEKSFLPPSLFRKIAQLDDIDEVHYLPHDISYSGDPTGGISALYLLKNNKPVFTHGSYGFALGLKEGYKPWISHIEPSYTILAEE